MRSLFAKTLLWFLATTAIAITGIIITTAVTFSASEPRGPFGQLLNLQVEEARQAYETGGRAGLNVLLAKLQRIAQVQVVFTDGQGTDLITGQARPDLMRRPARSRWRLPFPFTTRPAIHRLISVRSPTGVLAKGGGSWIIGVRSESGCVRSTTSIEPETRPSTKDASVSTLVLN